jgi:Exocyst complex component Sec5
MIEIRQHCYHILLILVIAHATINEVSRALLKPIFAELIQILAQELLSTYRIVDRFSTGGMLQVPI